MKASQRSVWGIVAIAVHFGSTNALAVDIKFADLVPEKGLVRHECAARNLYGIDVRTFEPTESGAPCSAADEKAADVSDHDMKADQTVANAIRHAAYEILQPIDDATLSQKLSGCRGFAPLGAFRDWVHRDLVGGKSAAASLLGIAIDGSFEKIDAEFDDATRSLIAEDGIQGYVLGETITGGELLGIVAFSYSNHDLSDGTLKAQPKRPDDVRVAVTGILHLISVPNCRYGGGLIFRSRAFVKQKISFMYEDASKGRSDFIHAPWWTREYVRNDLVRIAGRVFLLSADLPHGMSRELFIDLMHEQQVQEIVKQGAWDRWRSQKQEILPALVRQGIPFRIEEPPPQYRLKVWEIGLLDDMPVVAQWIEPESAPFDPAKCSLIDCMPEQ